MALKGEMVWTSQSFCTRTRKMESMQDDAVPSAAESISSVPLEAKNALPYVDTEYDDPGMQGYVHQLVEEEMAQLPERDYLGESQSLPPYPELRFASSELLRNEWERVSAGRASQPLDRSRYDARPPPSELGKDLSAWKGAVRNAKAQLEHQQNRQMNLELLQNFGASAWLSHNQYVKGATKLVEERTKRVREEAAAINRQRYTQQEEVRPELEGLRWKRGELVHKNLQIEIACMELARENKRRRAELEAQGVTIPSAAQDKENGEAQGEDAHAGTANGTNAQQT